MFGLIPPSFYIYAALSIAAVGGLWYGHHESVAFSDFKAQVEAQVKIQEQHNESVVKQQDLVSKGIKNDYESKLAAIRNFYSSGVQHPSGSSVSGISPAPRGTDAETAYPILAGQCAETTQQTVSLQDWIKQQAGIK